MWLVSCDLSGGRERTCESFQSCRPLIQPCRKGVESAAGLHLGKIFRQFSRNQKRHTKGSCNHTSHPKSYFEGMFWSIFLRVFELFFSVPGCHPWIAWFVANAWMMGSGSQCFRWDVVTTLAARNVSFGVANSSQGWKCHGNWCLMFDEFCNKRVCSLPLIGVGHELFSFYGKCHEYVSK